MTFKDLEKAIAKYKEGILLEDRQDLIDMVFELSDQLNELGQKVQELPDLEEVPEPSKDRTFQLELAKKRRYFKGMLAEIELEKLTAAKIAAKYLEVDVVGLANYLGVEATVSDKEIDTAKKIIKNLKTKKGDK